MDKFLTEKSSRWLILFGFIILVIGIFSFIIFQTFNIKSETFTIENFSQFGGFIGGVVGSLWSLAGFILFYIALNKQKEDLEINRKALESQIASMNLQTEEFKAQVQELEETRKVYIEQNKTQSLQRFENTFFNMLSLHHKIVEGIDVNVKEFIKINSEYYDFLFSSNEFLRLNNGVYKSRDAFKITYLHLEYLLKINFYLHLKNPKTNTNFSDGKGFSFDIEEFNKLSFIDNNDNFNNIYLFIYNKLNTDFGHYFRNLYRIIKMIDEQIFDSESQQNDFEKKYYYTSIVRAQLSDYELLWIFFNCNYEFGSKFKPLIEKYAFLKVLSQTNDLVLIKYKSFYKETAFGLK